MNSEIQVIAYYLPQFHRLKFNDDYWGKGFTEWTNTAKARPLFRGHYQPHIPADLGFYDLSVASARREQAELAKQYGVSAFCYWHYWLGINKEVMEMPFNEVLKDSQITLPFCLAWANHDWHNVKTREVIIRQEYGGKDDYELHYKKLSSAFHDSRYFRIDNKPVFVIFSPFEIPNTKEFFNCWNDLSIKDGLDGIYFIAIVKNNDEINEAVSLGYNAVNTMRLQNFEYHLNKFQIEYRRLKHLLFKTPYVYNYSYAMRYFIHDRDKEENVIPTIISGWDHTPRSGNKGLVLNNFTPSLFAEHVKRSFDAVKKKKNKVVFVRAWNEWAEGNHLEPDLKYGLQYLEVIKNSLSL